MQMQKPRSFHFLDILQNFYNLCDIIAIEGPEIPDVQSFEYVLFTRYKRFERVVESLDTAFALILNQTPFLEEIEELEADTVITRRGGDFGQVSVECPDVVVNRHIIVIENDKQIVGVVRCVVEAFECQAAADGRIAYQRDCLAVFLTRCVQVGYGHTQRRGNGIAGMPAYECVKLALKRKGKAAYSVLLALIGKGFEPACQEFMSIGLVADIVDNAVARSVEYIMQGHYDFNRTHTRPEMSRIYRQAGNQIVAYFLA